MNGTSGGVKVGTLGDLLGSLHYMGSCARCRRQFMSRHERVAVGPEGQKYCLPCARKLYPDAVKENKVPMREALELVESVLQGESPRRVIRRALNEYGGERGDHDGEHVRVTVIDHPGNRILITEFPGKPVKRKVRVYDMDTSWQVQAYHKGGSAYLSSNIFRDMQFHNSMTYEQAKAALDKAVGKANEYATSDEGGGHIHLPQGHESTINFLEVEPKDYKPMSIEGKDFVLKCEWDKFRAYSPDSDFQQADPYYSVWNSKSAQGARTVFKALSWDPTALRNMPWSKFGDWCREAGVGVEMNHSVWH